jgi:hypothetical protein
MSAKPLGSTRLRLIELISLGIKLEKGTIVDKLTNSNLLETILALFSTFEWNNMLHNQVEKIITMILESPNKTLQAYVSVISASHQLTQCCLALVF